MHTQADQTCACLCATSYPRMCSCMHVHFRGVRFNRSCLCAYVTLWHCICAFDVVFVACTWFMCRWAKICWNRLLDMSCPVLKFQTHPTCHTSNASVRTTYDVSSPYQIRKLITTCTNVSQQPSCVAKGCKQSTKRNSSSSSSGGGRCFLATSKTAAQRQQNATRHLAKACCPTREVALRC